MTRLNTVAVAMCVALLPCCDASAPNEDPASSAPPPSERPPVEAKTAPAKPKVRKAPKPRADDETAKLLKLIEAKIAFHATRGHKTKSWLDLATAADGHLSRARLTGDLDAFAQADALLTAAEKVKGSGRAAMVRIQYLMALHEFTAADALLVKYMAHPLRKARAHAAALGLRGDAAFQRGDYSAALAHWNAALAKERSPAALSRLATYHHQTGRSDEAKRLLAEAGKAAIKGQGMGRAMVRLQRGLVALDQGRPAEALTHYRRADAAFSGWFLVREHIAEALVETGKHDEALALYLDVLESNPDPAFMSAVADIHAARGDAATAAEWRARTARAFDARVAQYPQAMTGHALDYYLEHGTAEKALRLAEQNHSLRPGGEAKVKLVGALIRAGQTDRARARLEEALASPYDTAPLQATASVLYAKLGDGARAKKHADRAKALADGAMEAVAWLKAAQ